MRSNQTTRHWNEVLQDNFIADFTANLAGGLANSTQVCGKVHGKVFPESWSPVFQRLSLQFNDRN
jgi:hypothetical protein